MERIPRSPSGYRRQGIRYRMPTGRNWRSCSRARIPSADGWRNRLHHPRDSSKGSHGTAQSQQRRMSATQLSRKEWWVDEESAVIMEREEDAQHLQKQCAGEWQEHSVKLFFANVASWSSMVRMYLESMHDVVLWSMASGVANWRMNECGYTNEVGNVPL